MSKLEQLQARAAAAKEQAGPAARSRVKTGATAGVLATLGLVLLKGKGIVLVVLTKLKLLLQFFTTAWTMLVAAWVYAMFYGWPFAAMFVGLILIHEIGHGVAARAVGMRVGVPVFIPFFGAYIQLKDQPRSQVENFIIAAGGPVVGGSTSLIVFAMSFVVSEPMSGLFRVVGYYGLWLNLFNLMPVWQLDGARMLAIVRPRGGLIGAVVAAAVLVGCAVAVDRVEPIPAMVLVVAVFRLGVIAWRARRTPRTLLDRVVAGTPQHEPSNDIPAGRRRAATVGYFALVAGFGVAAHVLQQYLPVFDAG